MSAETKRVFDMEEYLDAMTTAYNEMEIETIDHYPAEDDTPDMSKFKAHIRDLKAEVTQVRLAALKAHNRGITSFVVPVDVDHSIMDMIERAWAMELAGVV